MYWTHAAALTALDHQVTVGTRDVAAALARTKPDAMGTAPFPAWLERHPTVSLAGFAAAAAEAELLINATAGHAQRLHHPRRRPHALPPPHHVRHPHPARRHVAQRPPQPR
ncbi:hypothetical protein ABZ419_05185 [Streptomyces cinnamoneus]|uniref:hypothetical protein n=1 Tax=Streptomyces cinnamoneus TaxID=53446 RepID=UPI0034030C12